MVIIIIIIIASPDFARPAMLFLNSYFLICGESIKILLQIKILVVYLRAHMESIAFSVEI